MSISYLENRVLCKFHTVKVNQLINIFAVTVYKNIVKLRY